MILLVLKGALFFLLSFAGLVAVDVALSPLPKKTAWLWACIPGFFIFIFADVTLYLLSRITGAWRFHKFNPTPDLPDEAIPVYRPTAVGRYFALRSADFDDLLAEHPITAFAEGMREQTIFHSKRIRMHMRGASWRECREAGVL